MKINWKAILGAVSLSVGSLVGGYYLGAKNATEDILDTLTLGCMRGTLMQLPNGEVVVCGPIRYQPEQQQKSLQWGLDKDVA